MKAVAQLIRLPNVFTAVADIALGAFATSYLVDSPGTFAMLAAASACLYCSGMAWNDFFDREHDARTRPHRPIPSGRISPQLAALIAATLMIAGLLLAAATASFTFACHRGNPLWIAALLAIAILLYDSVLKSTPLGPVAMGLCRFLNVLLGLAANHEGLTFSASLHLAACVGIYVVGVTLLARNEEGLSNRRNLRFAAAVIVAGILLGFAMPVHRPPGTVAWYVPLLFIACTLAILEILRRVVRNPSAPAVQAAVKFCILGLIVFDALLAAIFVGWPGLLLILLLLPARWLSQWLYVT